MKKEYQRCYRCKGTNFKVYRTQGELGTNKECSNCGSHITEFEGDESL